MPHEDWRVIIALDFGIDYDNDDVEVDDAELHDAIMEHFDTVDLEFEYEGATYDEGGDEIEDETQTYSVNCDNVRQIEVEKVTG